MPEHRAESAKETEKKVLPAESLEENPTEEMASATIEGVNLKEEKKKTKGEKKGKNSILKLERARYSFLKWFLGTFVIGAFTAYTTYIFKSYELKLKTRTTESTYLRPYLDSYMLLFSDNKMGYDRASDMAKFLSCAVIDPDYKKGWDSLFTYCQQMIGDIKKQNDTLKHKTDTLTHKLIQTRINYSSQVKKGGDSTPQAIQLRDYMASLVNQINANKILVKDNLKKIDPSAAAHQITTNAAQDQAKKPEEVQVAKVDQKANLPPPKPVDNYTIVNDSTMYISRKYAQTYNNTLEVYISKINLANQTVDTDIRFITDGLYSEPQELNGLELGKEAILFSPDQNFRYNIVLAKFGQLRGSSGRPVAYIKVTTYKRIS